MTGWEKVAAATLVAVIGLVALNLAIWRRMRAGLSSETKIEHKGERSTQRDHVGVAHSTDYIVDPVATRRSDLIDHQL